MERSSRRREFKKRLSRWGLSAGGRSFVEGLWFRLLLLVLTSLALAFLLAPGKSEHPLPISERDVGKVARLNVRASRDWTENLPDVVTTERRRQEAEAAVYAVYDYDQDVLAKRKSRIREAFALVRAATALPEDILPDLSFADLDGGPDRARPAEPKGHEGPDRTMAFEAVREDYSAALGLRPKDCEKEYQIFSQEGFSPITEDALVEVLEAGLSHPLISNRLLLEGERGRGIILRTMRGGVAEEETTLGTFGKIWGMAEAKASVARMANGLNGFNPKTKLALASLASKLISPTMIFNLQETNRRKQEAREAVAELVEVRSYRKGQVLIRSGEVITPESFRVLKSIAEMSARSNTALATLGIGLSIAIFLAVIFWFAKANIRKFRRLPRDLLFQVLILLLSLASMKVGLMVIGAVQEKWPALPLSTMYYAIPFATGAMMIRMVLNSETAVLYSLAFAILSAILADFSLPLGIFAGVTSLAGAGGVGRVTQRSAILNAGALTGLVGGAIALSLGLVTEDPVGPTILLDCLGGFIGGLLASFFVAAITPAIEALFGYTTNIKLLELANMNNPLLQEMGLKAPGTWHHSIVVGSLVEAAAHAADANPLLARVGALYHDLGKIRNPQYFAENQRVGQNRHDKLKPSMSALILKAHVKDGLEMAKSHRVGRAIEEIIVQHHGTTLISFFYHKAKGQAGQEGVNEAEFRYPGPNPQSREAAIVMLADSVEAAARSLEDPTPSRLQGLVQKIINTKFTDGQLAECSLTLKDLNEIARSFNRVLQGIYHHRPDYQAIKRAREAAASKRETQDNGDRGPQEGNGDGYRPQNVEEKSREDLKRLGI